MAYKNILVQVDTKSGSAARLEAAANTAARFNASLTGMFLKSASLASDLADDLSAETVKKIQDEREANSLKNLKAAKKAFEEASKGVAKTYWLEFVGDSDQKIIEATRCFDLVVFQSIAGVEAGRNTILAEQIAMGSGGPVLVLPVGGYKPRLGNKVMVAYRDSREAARALNDAWPFLAEASEVHFVLAGKDAEDKLDPLLVRNLEEHGVKNVKVIVNKADDASTGEVIRRHIDMIGADMVVLGLYGHSRVQEYLMGGVSRYFMTELHCPLLVSH
jgi:nucleotide-binding universal stress UspA family protein